jgi:predicted nuclease of predicted toxin-antitoxin system
MSMLFKVDENLPVELAELLSDLGHDAKTVNDQRLQGVNDRVLPFPDHEGIILLRVGNQSKGHVLEVFKRMLPLIAQEPIIGRLWVVEENRVRIRGEDE